MNAALSSAATSTPRLAKALPETTICNQRHPGSIPALLPLQSTSTEASGERTKQGEEVTRTRSTQGAAARSPDTYATLTNSGLRDPLPDWRQEGAAPTSRIGALPSRRGTLARTTLEDALYL